MRFFSFIYTLALMVTFELVLFNPSWWWVFILLWLVNLLVLYLMVRLKSLSLRDIVPPLILLVLSQVLLFFFEGTFWQHTMSVLISLILGHYFYTLFTVSNGKWVRHLRQLLVILNVFLSSSVALSMNIFLRFPWYIVVLLFLFFIITFNGYLPGDKSRFLGRSRWLPILIATELFLVSLILPINFFSRAVIISFGFHLANFIGRGRREMTRQVIVEQVILASIFMILVLLTSRWI